jgi:transposase
LLSAQGKTIKDIAQTDQVHRVTVSAWSHKWEQHGAESLHAQPRSGRPCKLTAAEQALARQYLKDEPRALKAVVDRLAQKPEQPLPISTLKRWAKKARLRWKRVRKSLKKLRDPDAFARCQRELEALQQQEDQGHLNLYYFDEAGFALDPTIPYAWQEPNSVIELPAFRTGRINGLGFMNRQNDLHAYMFEQSIHTGGGPVLMRFATRSRKRPWSWSTMPPSIPATTSQTGFHTGRNKDWSSNIWVRIRLH